MEMKEMINGVGEGGGVIERYKDRIETDLRERQRLICTKKEEEGER